jgi:hypothetical protein
MSRQPNTIGNPTMMYDAPPTQGILAQGSWHDRPVWEPWPRRRKIQARTARWSLCTWYLFERKLDGDCQTLVQRIPQPFPTACKLKRVVRWSRSPSCAPAADESLSKNGCGTVLGGGTTANASIRAASELPPVLASKEWPRFGRGSGDTTDINRPPTL